MARTLTSNVGIQMARESALGVLPGSPLWLKLQPNTIGRLGASMTSVSRQPISRDRLEYKGDIVDLESGVEIEADTTMDLMFEFIEAFMMADFVGPRLYLGETAPTAVTATGYTVASTTGIVANRLVWADGFPITANNGLKVVTGTTGTEVQAAGLSAESTPVVSGFNQMLAECGVRCATGDVTASAAGLASTTTNFTTLPIRDGQLIKIGGALAANQFNTANNNTFARVRKGGISATALLLDWQFSAMSVDAGTGKNIDIYYGPFVRNVPTDHVDALTDRSYTAEGDYPDLQAVGTPAFEYPRGNMANVITFNMPQTEKATVRLAFVGTDTAVPTTVRATNAATGRVPRRTQMFNTVTKYTRLSVNNLDESGINTDIKNYTIEINNNVSGERVQGTLGSKYINYGIFQMMIDGTMLFTDPDVISAIRNNTTIAFKMGAQNGNGGFFMDIPAATLMTGEKDFPVNQSVQIRAPIKPVVGDEFPYVVSFSLFPYLPPAV